MFSEIFIVLGRIKDRVFENQMYFSSGFTYYLEYLEENQ